MTPEIFKKFYGEDKIKKVAVVDDNDEHHGRELQLLNLTQFIWTERDQDDRIILPWVYRTENEFSEYERGNITLYIETMENKLGIIKFKQRDQETDYLELTNDNDGQCASYVGKIGGKQPVYFSSDCFLQGIFEHEIMHVLGVFHEHTRIDRDEYVTILEENIEEGYESNFLKRSSDHTTDLGVPYDYGSVMHYDQYAFSKERGVLKTINTTAVIGQRDGMSMVDIKQLRLMYKCPGGSRHESVFCSTDCLCLNGEGTCTDSNQCEGSLACNNGVCGTASPTPPPVTYAPTTPYPTRYPTMPIVIRKSSDNWWVDGDGNIRLDNIAGLGLGVFAFIILAVGIYYYYRPQPEIVYYGPYLNKEIV